MITMQNVRKKYKDFELELSLEIPEGRITGFVGKNGADYGYIYAAAIISILPIIIIYFLMQDSFVEGMTTGSVKG